MLTSSPSIDLLEAFNYSMTPSCGCDWCQFIVVVLVIRVEAEHCVYPLQLSHSCHACHGDLPGIFDSRNISTTRNRKFGFSYRHHLYPYISLLVPLISVDLLDLTEVLALRWDNEDARQNSQLEVSAFQEPKPSHEELAKEMSFMRWLVHRYPNTTYSLCRQNTTT